MSAEDQQEYNKRNDIAAGDKLPEGTTVILFISKGAEGFEMPNVTGMSEAQAKATLQQTGLVVKIKHVQTDSASEGTVLSQSIPAGTNVKLGTEIEISVATATPVTEETSSIATGMITTAETTNVTTISTITSTTVDTTPVTTTSTTSSTTTTTTTLPQEYTITVDPNGGSNVPSFKRSYGDPIGTLPTSERDYYRLTGWTSNGAAVSSNTVVRSNMTLTAQWELKDEWSDWSSWSKTVISEEKDSNGLLIVQVDKKYHERESVPQYSYMRYVNSDRTIITANPDWTSGSYSYEFNLTTDEYDYIGDEAGTPMYRAPDGSIWYNKMSCGQTSRDPYTEYRYRTRIK